MKKSARMFGAAALAGVLWITMACGGGGDATQNAIIPPPPLFEVTINPDGTATTGAAHTFSSPPGTTGYLAAASVTLPASTTITAFDAGGNQQAFTAAPQLVSSVPSDSTATHSGVNGVPVPSGFSAVASTSGAIDIRVEGAASVTFSKPIIITMPVPGKAVGATVQVYTVTGTAYTLVPGSPFTVTTAGHVSFPVSSLSWKVGDPVFTTATGGTGGPGGTT